MKPQAVKKIRFGVMSESPILKAWEAECIDQALRVKNVELSLLIYTKQEQLGKKEHLKRHEIKQENRNKKLLFHVYNAIFFAPRCFSRVDISDKYNKTPFMICQTISKNSSEILKKEDIRNIKTYDLDFIILLSDIETVEGKILDATKYGIWSFHHAAIDKHMATPPYFWEHYNNEGVGGAALLRLTSKADEVIILKKGFFKAFNFSYIKTIENIYVESAKWIKEVCMNMINDSADYLKNPPAKIKTSVNGSIKNSTFLRFFAKLLKNRIINFFQQLFFIEQWNIGYINSSLDEVLEKKEMPKVKWLSIPSKNISYSDPFLLKLNHDYHIVFEYLDTKIDRGNIAYIRLDSDGSISDTKIILDKSYHMSYPYIFIHENDICMIPETWKANEITLYKSRNFPLKWEKKACLIENISAVDATLFEYNGLFWLTCTKREEGPDLRLFIYYSKVLAGPWLPHKKNPVKTDIRSTHPAGNIFYYKNHLIRPSQDCSKTYGGRIILNKINILTPEHFEEEPFKIISPNPKEKFKQGIHTINAVNDLTVLDAKRSVFYPSKVGQIIKKKIPVPLYKKKLSPKYRFISIPKFVERNEYNHAIDKLLGVITSHKEVKAIYQYGNINHPGISDIDILVVFKDNTSNNFHPVRDITGIDSYLLVHDMAGICESHFKQVYRYSLYHNMKYLWGERIDLDKKINTRSETEALKRQTAIEYLIDNYIDLTVQLKYGVVKLRSVLQHIKAIRYDLEFLNIFSGKLYDMVIQLTMWLEDWFQKPADFNLFCDWIDEFYEELEILLQTYLKEYNFFIPKYSNLNFSRNIRIECGESLEYVYSGSLLPKALMGLNKRVFNLNTRLNRFLFRIPFRHTADDKIVEARYLCYQEIVKHVSKQYPYFQPPITGVAVKTLKIQK